MTHLPFLHKGCYLNGFTKKVFYYISLERESTLALKLVLGKEAMSIAKQDKQYLMLLSVVKLYVGTILFP